MTARVRGKKRVCVGTVMSDGMQKTIVVDVTRVSQHPLYGKVVRASSRCYVHDEREEAHPGDLVRIMECRPLSKLKRWRLVEIMKRGAGIETPRDDYTQFKTARKARGAAEEPARVEPGEGDEQE